MCVCLCACVCICVCVCRVSLWGWEPSEVIPMPSKARIMCLYDAFNYLCGSTRRDAFWVTLHLRGLQRSLLTLASSTATVLYNNRDLEGAYKMQHSLIWTYCLQLEGNVKCKVNFLFLTKRYSLMFSCISSNHMQTYRDAQFSAICNLAVGSLLLQSQIHRYADYRTDYPSVYLKKLDVNVFLLYHSRRLFKIFHL